MAHGVEILLVFSNGL